jgi:hypothetical protein
MSIGNRESAAETSVRQNAKGGPGGSVWNPLNKIELKRTDGPAAHTSATLPSLTKGQRLNVPVDGGLVYAEVTR